MNKISVIIVLCCFSVLANAQSIFKKEANWMDEKNGVSYEMNINSRTAKVESTNLAKANFTAIGNLTLLDKIELLQDDKLKLNLPIKMETTEIQLKPGLYKFKIYHKKLGIKDFEVELKTTQTNYIKLTIK